VDTDSRSFRRWLILLRLGRMSGCHQMASRSFMMGNYQFPVCARCTGAYLGELIAVVSLMFGIRLPLTVAGGLALVMLGDWSVQRLGILASTNTRRFTTGLVGGFGLIQLAFWSFMFCKLRLIP